MPPKGGRKRNSLVMAVRLILSEEYRNEYHSFKNNLKNIHSRW
jgi:hypothetical protein